MIKKLSIGLAAVNFSTLVTVGAELNKLTDTEVEQGWILLFDGETLFGWEAATEVDWRVEDGDIVATPRPGPR